MLAEMGIWILLAIVGLAGIIIGVLLTLWLRRVPEAKLLKKNLPEIRESIVRLTDNLQSLAEFAQQTAYLQVTGQLRDTQSRLDQSLEAVRSIQEKLSEQSIVNGQRHSGILKELQEAQSRLDQSLEAVRGIQKKLSEQSIVDEQRHSGILKELQEVQSRLDQSLEAVRGIQEKFSEQSMVDEQRHSGILKELQEAHKALTSLQSLLDQIANQVRPVATMEKAMERIEERVGELTTILLGRRSGQAGERVVEKLLSPLPDDWLERDISLGRGKVEFALKMPGGYFVPLDSKFVAPEIATRLAPDNGGDEREQQQVIQQINEIVRRRAQEIAERYLVDERVLGFGIAAVPDAAYEACKSAIQTSAQRHQIVIIPYSLLLPYALSLYLIAQRLGITRMSEKERAMITAQTALRQAKTHLENMAREVTSVSNLREKALTQVETALNLLVAPTTNEQDGLPT